MSFVLALLAQTALSKAQIEAMAADRKAFEPYRICVLAEARALYPSGNNLEGIFDEARKRCSNIAFEVTIELAANAVERAVNSVENGHGQEVKDYSSDPMATFSNELIMELARDFVPRVSK